MVTSVAAAGMGLALVGPTVPATAATAGTVRVSLGSGGAQGNSDSAFSAIDATGRHVAFSSTANNLVAGDSNGVRDMFVHDVATGGTRRVSVSNTGAQANGPSLCCAPAISGDGRYVAFTSTASNLVAGDTNGVADVFVRDVLMGQTRRVDVSSTGAQANAGPLSDPAISSDGRYVAFISLASNLVAGDTNGERDVFVRDVVNAQTTLMSDSAPAGFEVAISANGRYVAFQGNDEQVFVRDRVGGPTELVTVDSNEVPGNGFTGFGVAVSADGRYVVFGYDGDDLVSGDTNAVIDVFVRDRSAGTTTQRVSVSSTGAQGNGASYLPAISANGRYVAY